MSAKSKSKQKKSVPTKGVKGGGTPSSTSLLRSLRATQGIKPLYHIVDKLEFFLSGDTIITDDVPKTCYFVTIPLTEQKTLRVAKVNSVRVAISNRSSHDLYLEILQPFGAHNDPSTVVAWGPVKGRKGKPQVRWTVKANSTGGTFKCDVSDNSITLPAVHMSSGNMYMVLFAFAVTQNTESFAGVMPSSTGSAVKLGSRALSFKTLFDYNGTEPSTDLKSEIGTAEFSEFGKVNSWPSPSIEQLWGSLGAIPLSTLLGVDSADVIPEPLRESYLKYNFLVADDSQFRKIFDPDQSQRQGFYMRMDDATAKILDELANEQRVQEYPIRPVNGCVWRTDDVHAQKNILAAGVGTCVVKGNRFPLWMQPANLDSWYVAALYHNKNTRNYAPVLGGGTERTETAVNYYAGTQSLASDRHIYFNQIISYAGPSVISEKDYPDILVKRPGRLLIPPRLSAELDEVGLTITWGVFVAMVSVVIDVVEAAYNIYSKYTPTKLDVKTLPGHTYVDDVNKLACDIGSFDMCEN